MKREARKKEAWMERWKSCGERRITLKRLMKGAREPEMESKKGKV